MATNRAVSSSSRADRPPATGSDALAWEVPELDGATGSVIRLGYFTSQGFGNAPVSPMAPQRRQEGQAAHGHDRQIDARREQVCIVTGSPLAKIWPRPAPMPA